MPSSAPPSYVSRTSSQAEHESLKRAYKSTDDKEDDKRSTRSRSSQASRPESISEALLGLVGDRVRHAKCAPEYLEEVAKRGGDGVVKDTTQKYKVVAGSDAVSLLDKFLHEADEQEEKQVVEKDHQPGNSSPLVFALTAWDAGRKVVDYYMTWRGKTGTQRLTGSHRRTSMLDAEFRTVARSLDKEYKRSRRANSTTKHRRSTLGKENHDQVTSSHSKTTPPQIVISSPAVRPPAADSPVSAISSVISLPLLSMIRGVPLGNRMQLRVTNPDAASILTEAIDESSPETPSPESDNLFERSLATPGEHDDTPATSPDETLAVPKLQSNMSSASTTSSRSSRSSQSSRSTSHRHDKSDGDRSSRHKHSSRSTKKSSRHHDETSRRQKDSVPKEESTEFVIVLVDEKMDKDELTWHGLNRRSSTKTLVVSHNGRHSPWSGPLVRSDGTYRSSASRPPSIDSSDESSDDEDGWLDSPVVPMKALMQAISLARSSASYTPSVVIPNRQYQQSVATPAPSIAYESPYTYNSPQISNSSYVPAWMSPSQAPNAPLSRAPSRAYTVGYGSPHMQHLAPY